jgi:Asp-tRNA(Asn)/Glu-tRNA(Gln) amidotransferase C subunit
MITYDELKKLAALAKLSLDGEDMDALAKDISNILEFADTIAQAAVDRRMAKRITMNVLLDDILSLVPVDEILPRRRAKVGYFVVRKRGGLRHGIRLRISGACERIGNSPAAS